MSIEFQWVEEQQKRGKAIVLINKKAKMHYLLSNFNFLK